MLTMMKAIVMCMIILSPGHAHDVDESVDVVVLGAGMAGIAAAQRLRELDRDLSVIVVEGTDRVGGRVKERFHLNARIMLIVLIGG